MIWQSVMKIVDSFENVSGLLVKYHRETQFCASISRPLCRYDADGMLLCMYRVHPHLPTALGLNKIVGEYCLKVSLVINRGDLRKINN